ncbi:hypothetical protein COU01_01020 [Candidatus Falkowbacteria bacterium CG10_big_fil_rev_8_21_14_0_10_44_15]|uniref:Clp R domain-containing protein n=1 Tax=Candidatus Falkowbacteria bacterium CG10_big_fil_rev_8_21_14_0_10_44_15 TaxID=1974569 RepID=A0A2H0V0I6_9BACT|nr:MAG: hypothetical protein COU01_01020 [Candidatus Falkowbacteria bacterium CG10_big_fil_rev_8_21_14_0_10_44_15]
MSNLSSQFVTCPNCNGTGKINKFTCNNCGGIGLGTFIKNDFLYWGYDLTPAKIIVRQSQLIFDYALDAFFLILGAAGILSLGWWLYQNAAAAGYKVYLSALVSFWGAKDNLILYFWLGLLLLCFSWYRFQRRKEKHPPVKILTYRQQAWLNKQPQIIPNNWQELKSFPTKVNVASRYRYELLQLLEKAYALATQFGHPELTPAHLMLTIVSEYGENNKNVELKKASAILARLGVYRGKIGPKLEQALQKISPVNDGPETTPILSKELRQALIESYVQARDNGHYYIEMPDLIGPLISAGRLLRGILAELGIRPEQIQNSAQWLLLNDRYARREENYRQKNKKTNRQSKLSMTTTAVATPILNHFCLDLTRQPLTAGRPIFVDREAELGELFKAFSEGKRQIILTGEKGAGKKSLINHLAEQIAADEVPACLKNRRLLKLDLNKIKNKASGIDWEKKLLVILQELIKTNGILVVVDGPEELEIILNKYGGNFYLLAAADQKLAGAHNIELSEPTSSALIQILASNAVLLEHEYKITFNYEALLVTAQAAKNYPSGEALPGKAVRLLNTVAKSYTSAADRTVNADAAAKVISGEVGVPYTKILKEMNN